MSTKLTKSTTGSAVSRQDYFAPEHFEHVQRVAKALAASTIVPKEFQGNIANCIVALEMSQRMNIQPFMVMQNLYIVHGRPTWKSEFVISALRNHPEFTRVKFERDDEDGGRCRVVATDTDGDKVVGTWVSIKMAKSEGWYSRKDRNGNETSKWPSMPEQMLMYRAASFFARVHCPEILNGMRPADEVADIDSYRRESDAVQAINDEITDRVKFTSQVEDAEVVDDLSDDLNEELTDELDDKLEDDI